METEREINGVLCRSDTSNHVSLVVVGSTTAPVYRVMQCAVRPACRTEKRGSQRDVTHLSRSSVSRRSGLRLPGDRPSLAA